MKNIFFAVLFCVSSFSFAQAVKLEGTISDTKSLPVEMANVMAVNQATKGMDSYAITNDKGKYSLSLKPNTTYSIKISFLGMQSKEVEIVTTATNISKNITLEDSAVELDGVEIIREMPVSIKGDTIVYNADSFKSGTERKLEDVLKKLPGVEVNADVILKGTRVDGVYDCDPEKNANAIKYDSITFEDVLKKGLNVMDTTAFTLSQENELPIVVFDMNTKGNLLKICNGDTIGTVVKI